MVKPSHVFQMTDNLNSSGEPLETEREFLERILKQVQESQPTNGREMEEKDKFLQLIRSDLDRAKVCETIEKKELDQKIERK